MTTEPMTTDMLALTAGTAERLDRLLTMTYTAAHLTEPDAARLTDELAFVQSVRRGVTEARERMLAPLRLRLGELREAYDRILARVTTAESTLKATLLAWRQHREAEAAKAAQEAVQAAAALAAAEAQRDAAAAGFSARTAHALATQVEQQVIAEMTPQIVPAEPPRATEGLVGTASVRLTWTYEVVAPDEVPREYLILNAAAVTQAIRNGARAIPGLRIYQREGMAMRARR
jgi:hypothetical protein